MKWFNSSFWLVLFILILGSSCGNSNQQQIEQEQAWLKVLSNSQGKIDRIADNNHYDVEDLAVNHIQCRPFMNILRHLWEEARSTQTILTQLKHKLVEKVSGSYTEEEAIAINQHELAGKQKPLRLEVAVKDILVQDTLAALIPIHINQFYSNFQQQLKHLWEDNNALFEIKNDSYTLDSLQALYSNLATKKLQKDWANQIFAEQNVSRGLLLLQILQNEVTSTKATIANLLLLQARQVAADVKEAGYQLVVKPNKLPIQLGESYRATIQPFEAYELSSHDVQLIYKDKLLAVENHTASITIQPTQVGNDTALIFVAFQNLLTGELDTFRNKLWYVVE